MQGREPPRWAHASLLAWWCAAAALFWLAPPPPPAPLAEPESEAIFQRQVDQTVARTRRWQDSRGDLWIPWAEARGHLAIVIDDVGGELHHFEQLLALRFPLTFSVAPGGVYAAGAQLRLRSDRRRPREILLHLPREEILHVGDSPELLRAALHAALERVPVAVGVKGPAGSQLTADRAAMDALMPALRERGLFFLDAWPTPHSQALPAAAVAGVPALGRDVYLADDPRPDAILAQLERAAARAREAPTVVIAQPSREVVEVLRAELPRLHREGIGVYPLREILGRASSENVRE